jgi:hypothetical protein
MEFVEEQLKNISKSLEKLNKNGLVTPLLTVSLILYSSLAAPKLPKMVAKLFDNNLFKLVYMFCMFYLASNNLYASIICAVALLIALQTLLSYETTDNVIAPPLVSVPVVKPNVDQVVNSVMKSFVVEPLDDTHEYPTNGDVVESLEDTQAYSNERPSREVLVDACIKKAEAYYDAANKAKLAGDSKTAELHLDKAVKNEAKAIVLNKAGEAKQAVEKAVQEGQPSEVVNLANNRAHNEEQKALLVVQAESVSQDSRKAQQVGNLEKAQQLNQHVEKLEEKIVALSKDPVKTGNSSCGGTELNGLETGNYASF